MKYEIFCTCEKPSIKTFGEIACDVCGNYIMFIQEHPKKTKKGKK